MVHRSWPCDASRIRVPGFVLDGWSLYVDVLDSFVDASDLLQLSGAEVFYREVGLVSGGHGDVVERKGLC